MIDPSHDLPVCRQAELLEISRSNVYYLPQPVCEADLVLMRRIDELHLNFPFAGARMLRDMLKLEGFEVGRKHVRTLMGKMGIAAAVPQAQDERSAPGAPDLPVPAQEPGHRAAEPGLGHRLDLHPHEARIRLPGGHHRLGHAPGPGSPGIDQHDHRLLRRSPGRGDLPSTVAPEIFNTDSKNARASCRTRTASPFTVMGRSDLAPQDAPGSLTRTPIDRHPCLSLDPSAVREPLAARLRLADACDPRRA